MKDLILIKKKIKSVDNCRTISIRVHNETINRLDCIVKETNMSRNAIINRFISYGLDHCTVIKKE